MGDEDDLLKAAQKNDATKLTSILDRYPSLLRMHTPNGTLVLTAMYYDAADAVKVLLDRTASARFPETAASTAVFANRLGSFRFTSAPCSRRTLIASGWPKNAASPSGVKPSSLFGSLIRTGDCPRIVLSRRAFPTVAAS